MKISIKTEYGTAKAYANALHFARLAAAKNVDLSVDEERMLVTARGLIETREATLVKKGLRQKFASEIQAIKNLLDQAVESKNIAKAVENWKIEFDSIYRDKMGVGTGGGTRKADPVKVIKRLIHDASLIGIPEKDMIEFIKKYK